MMQLANKLGRASSVLHRTTMSEAKSTHDRVLEVVSHLTQGRVGPVNPDSRLVEDLSLDSVALLELAIALETEFDLPLMNAATTSSIVTVRELQEHVEEQARRKR